MPNIMSKPFIDELYSDSPKIGKSSIPSYWGQLLILGNGFDLQCGLKSSFTDFYKPRKTMVDLFNRELHRVLTIKRKAQLDLGELTVWDLMLDSPLNNWCDIEKTIEDWVTDTEKITKIVHALNEYRKWIQYKSASFNSFSGLDYESQAVVYYVSRVDSNLKIPYTPKRLYAFLLSELKRLELTFTDYLIQEVKKKNYFDRSTSLLYDLIQDQYPTDGETEVKNSVLDFNYTNPIQSELSSNMQNDFTLVNIHGSLRKNNIVFGIDAKDHMDNDGIMPFTKTYRLLFIKDPDRGKLVDTYGPHTSALNPATDLIKFYGHSLAQADNSYFQSIFDEVNLYAGQTKLIFYYRPANVDYRNPPDDISDREIKSQQNMAHQVVTLIGKYGKSMDNHDHGENLLHKLILEGRLEIKLFKYETEKRFEQQQNQLATQ